MLRFELIRRLLSMLRRWKFWLPALLLAVAAAAIWRASQLERFEVGPLQRPEFQASFFPGTSGIAAAARKSAARLFHYVDPANRAELDATLPAPAAAIHYVRVDAALAFGKRSPFWQAPGEGRVSLPLPSGDALMIEIEASEMLGFDRFTSTGCIAGRPRSRATFAWCAGFLHAVIDDLELGTFALRAATDELAQFYRIDPERVRLCGGTLQPTRAAAELAPAPSAPAVPAALRASDALENPQRAEVHVMFAYTRALLPTLAGAARVAALQSAFDLEIARANEMLAASYVSARLRLVGRHETDYDENASAPNRVQDAALTALQKTDDGVMDEIHAARDAAGADIVVLALQRFDFSSSGLSFLLDAPDDPRNAQFAFSVLGYTDLIGTTLLAHELGHVFGCAHARGDAGTSGVGDGAYAYSYGYRFLGADGRQYRDIMAYAPGTQLPYFSNPQLLAPAPVSVRLGVPPGQPGEANAALTIEQNAFAAAAYRLQTQSPASIGTLLNVATRAYVSRGEQVIIGGFVIEGRAEKRVLIRGVGPSLASFGLATPLVDPILRVFSGANQIATNDNVSANDPALAAAAQAGAFPFLRGSADAAVLTSLPPGAYTAVLEGARNTEGFGLIEVYDAAPNLGGARVVNLAARAYADNRGRELYGGFVIEAPPGATKRVLIRVLGPTLARDFGITGALHDPVMALHNTIGDVVLRADDWSSGTTLGSASEANDFRPLVRSHSEADIAATGLAPKNRREPCLLVDLPAGNYTVRVWPYERRDTDPALDQPAQPGVGVIEIFELP